jgi:hypothetical protein
VNRKGYVFSLLVIVIIGVLIASATYREELSQMSDAGQLLGADAYVRQLERDVPRVLFISGYRGLLGLEEHVSTTGEFLTDLPAAFREVVQNGTVEGQPYQVMDEATLEAFQERIAQTALALGLSVRMNLTEVTLEHTGPFTLLVNSTLTINATTLRGDARWDFTSSAESEFSISQLKDPLYAVSTLGRVPAVITPVNQTAPYITSGNDTTALQVIFNKTQYVPDTNGPSLLMRFTGDLGPSPYGIASLLDTKELDVQGIGVDQVASVVDYEYFGPAPRVGLCIVNMESHVRVHSEALPQYYADDKTVPC